ncbi:YfhO family protein [Candidatus Woesebacteria bacterium]|nr:YfhO family protein [Candidatus Woesebacteria bacterium]
MKGLKKKLLAFFKKFSPFLFIVLIISGFFWRVFLFREVPIPGDFITGVYYPWLDYKWGYAVGVPVKNPIESDVVSLIFPDQSIAVKTLLSGVAPLWNSYKLNGVPLMANFQSAAFSPSNVVFFFLDSVKGWTVQIILQHILAAVFTFVLLRYWKVSIRGSLLGGTVYSLSGFNMIFSQWNGHVLSAAFVPLIILFTEKSLNKVKVIDGVLLSISLALQILSGYPLITFYTVPVILLLWIFRFRFEKSYLFKSFCLGVFLLLGLGIAAVQLLPSFELWGLSQRGSEPLTLEWAFLPFRKIITFIAPDFFGNHTTYNYWGPQEYTSNTGYVGIMAMFLSLLSLKNIKFNNQIKFLFVLMALTLILAFRTPVSFALWNYNILGMKAESAHRIMVLFTLCTSLLAGFGLDILLTKRLRRKDMFISLTPIFCVLVFFLFYAISLRTTHTVGLDGFKIGIRNLVIPSIMFLFLVAVLYLINVNKKLKTFGITLIFIAIIFELFKFGWKFNTFSKIDLVYPTTPVIDFLTNQKKPFRVLCDKVIPTNFCNQYGIETPEGQDTIQPIKNSQFLVAINGGDIESSEVRRYGVIDNDTSSLLDLVNTKYILTLKTDSKNRPSKTGEIPERFNNPRFKNVYEDKSVAVIENKASLPRAFMVYNWDVEKSNLKILKSLMQKDFQFDQKIILEKEITLEKSQVQGQKQLYKVEYLEYNPQVSKIRVNTSSFGLLFVSDSYYPGWSAQVDGKGADIYRADFLFRAIPVNKGEHEVDLMYDPESFNSGKKITIFSVFMASTLLSVSIFGKKAMASYTKTKI